MKDKKAMGWEVIGILVAIIFTVVFLIWLFVLKGNLGEGGNYISDLFKNI